MADETTETQEQQDVTQFKKSSKLKFVLIPLVLILQAAAAYYLVGNFFMDKTDTAEAAHSPEPPQTVGKFLEIGDLVINPAGTLGRRYLVFEMSLESHDAALIQEAESKKPWIRDAIISCLVKKTTEELLDVTKRDQLKTELLYTINKNLTKGEFKKIYFTKFIMQ